MKKNCIVPMILAIALCACSKQGPAAYRGYYSFKTGGSVDVSGRLYELQRDTVAIDTTVREYNIGGRIFRDTVYRYTVHTDTLGFRDTTMLRRLVAESGQMHILGDYGKHLKLTMNITGGDPVVFDATAESDGSIRLGETRRMVALRPDSDGDPVSFDLSVGGSGRRYENVLIFDLVYTGKYEYDGFDGYISDSRINCIATENE